MLMDVLKAFGLSVAPFTIRIEAYHPDTALKKDFTVKAHSGMVFIKTLSNPVPTVVSLVDGSPVPEAVVLAVALGSIVGLTESEDPGHRVVGFALSSFASALLRAAGQTHAGAMSSITPERVLQAIEHLKDETTFDELEALFRRGAKAEEVANG